MTADTAADVMFSDASLLTAFSSEEEEARDHWFHLLAISTLATLTSHSLRCSPPFSHDHFSSAEMLRRLCDEHDGQRRWTRSVQSRWARAVGSHLQIQVADCFCGAGAQVLTS